jgi:hypothetical protein
MSLDDILGRLEDALARLPASTPPRPAPPEYIPPGYQAQPPEARYSAQPSFWYGEEGNVPVGAREAVCFALTVGLSKYRGRFASFGRVLYTPTDPHSGALVLFTVTACPLWYRYCGGRRDRCMLSVKGMYHEVTWKKPAGAVEVPIN